MEHLAFSLCWKYALTSGITQPILKKHSGNFQTKTVFAVWHVDALKQQRCFPLISLYSFGSKNFYVTYRNQIKILYTLYLFSSHTCWIEDIFGLEIFKLNSPDVNFTEKFKYCTRNTYVQAIQKNVVLTTMGEMDVIVIGYLD